MEERDKNIITNNPAENEIDLIEIVAKLWAKRYFIIKTTTIFAIIGLFIAIFTPNEYTATTTMVPQTGEKKIGGNLTGLAAMAGINIGSLSSGEILSPAVYPQILNNVNFQKELIYSKFSIEKANEPITYFEYRTNKVYSSFNLFSSIKKYTIGLPKLIIKAIKGDHGKILPINDNNETLPKLTIEENEVIKDLFKHLSLNVNNKEGYISLSFTCSEAKLSAEIIQKTQFLIQRYITEFKLEKVKENLYFIESSYKDAKLNFEDKQNELAKFRDHNISLTSAVAKTHEEKLISEYNLLYGIYTELAKQKEQAKISVTETTPIFTIIQPTTVPCEKSYPKRGLIFIVFAFLGSIASVGYLLTEPILIKLKNKLINK